MKFLADENFPRPAISVFRSLGYDVASVAEDHRGSTDEAVAEICDREARVLLTFDKDFGEMVFRRGISAGSSVVLLRIDPDPAAVVEIVRSLSDRGILTAGVFCVVTKDRVRVRALHLRK